MSKKKHSKKGLTLIELLIAASIAAFIGFGIYKTFANGIIVWKWIETNKPSGDVLIFFEKLSSDLRNHCNFSDCAFVGNRNKITFFVQDSDYMFLSNEEIVDSKKEQEKSIYKIEYIFEPQIKEIHRRIYKFGMDSWESSDCVLKGVSQVGYVFYLFDSASNGLIDRYSTSGQAPANIAVSLKLKHDNNKINNFRWMISMPIGKYAN